MHFLMSLLNFAHAGDIENVIASSITTTTGSLSAMIVTNLPVIMVVVAGLIGIFLAVRLVKRLISR